MKTEAEIAKYLAITGRDIVTGNARREEHLEHCKRELEFLKKLFQIIEDIKESLEIAGYDNPIGEAYYKAINDMEDALKISNRVKDLAEAIKIHGGKNEM